MDRVELFALLSGFVAGAFGLVRFAIAQQRNLTDRFMTFMESALQRQESANLQWEDSLDGLDASVRENSNLIRQISERLGH